MVWFETIAIHDNSLWTNLELIECPVHRQDTGIEDIDLIYLLGSNDSYSPSHGITLYLHAKSLPPLVCKLLAVVECFILITRRQNDSSGIDTASQTTTTSLIAAGLYKVLIIMTFQHLLNGVLLNNKNYLMQK